MSALDGIDERQLQQAEEMFARLRDLPEARQEEELNQIQDAGVQGLLRDLFQTLLNPAELREGFPIREGDRDNNNGIKIVRKLGGGGFGHTYLVDHTMGGQPYPEVLKLLRPDKLWFATPEQARELTNQFREEVRALKELNHPNIVGIIDSGDVVLRQGMPPVPWFTMDFIEGKRIAEPRWDGTTFISASSLVTTEQKVRCVRTLCDAMDHAHRSGRRHLDLTPMNVLLKSDGTPMLIDFGLTERVRPDWNNQPWTWRGTLPFMAPEQMGRQPIGVGRATDVHALGVLLYLLVTERLPYRMDEPDDAVLRDAILNRDRVPLSEHWKDGGPELDRIVGKAMDRDPSKRFGSAMEFGKALDEWLEVGPSFRKAFERARPYLLKLEEESRRLPLRGLDSSANDPSKAKRLDLDMVYVSLDTDQRRKKRKKENGPERDLMGSNEEDEPVPVLDAVREKRVTVILGDPGAGKTAFLNHLAFCLIRYHEQADHACLARLLGWTEEDGRVLPVMILLRRFVKWVREHLTNPKGELPRPSEAFLWQYFQTGESTEAGVVEGLKAAADEGWVLFFLDGIDEVPNRELRIFVRDCTMALANRYRKARIVVTCRTIPYQEKTWQLPGVPAFTLQPFDNPKIERFVRAWFDAHRDHCRMAPDQALSKTDKLIGAIRNPHRQELRRLAGNPMLLTVMALLQTDQRELPENRALLYKEVIELLLRRWQETRSDDGVMAKGVTELLNERGAGSNNLDRILWRLAWEAQCGSMGKGSEALADIPRAKLHAAFVELCATKDSSNYGWADELVEAINQRCGLLIPVEEHVFRFPHRSFQEYLAACYLLDTAKASNPERDLDRRVEDYPEGIEHLVDPSAYWREVIRWTVGIAVYPQNRPRDGIEIIDALCPEDVLSHPCAWERVWFAGEALQEMRVDQARLYRRGPVLADRVIKLLRQLVENPTQPLSSVNRHLAAVALGLLGDPRRGVAPSWPPTAEQPFFDWVGPVGPAPDFEMGGDPHAFQSPNPAVRQPIRSPFLIARYPVTNAQYDWFEKSGYFRERGLKGRDKSDPRFTVPNQPAVNVSWRDAMHFCAWLNARLDAGEITLGTLGVSEVPDRALRWRVGLPTEAQWELAARGPTGRWLPWIEPKTKLGDSQLVDRCNWGKSGIYGTSAVGLFPSGTSPFGALDMIGNVWEWTRSALKRRPAEDEDDVDRSMGSDLARVLRGGSWIYNVQDFLRCAARLNNHPAIRINAFGFRCVLVCGLASGG